ncbi:hypothetical protein HAP90_00285 [Klebsiella quasipneumoniae subsp. similipneumoniae]|uniref:hypothetical protein n=1 Tax=Klebsiella quasipneumoniae TaxID=1463165 RepID=UPI0013FD818C|nr:hypothetical protein [Klebsiella quasipneumoniae]NHJ27354.1 hypothetical protein [Klebsiella quasipneumoniae subsp. similipneumoniae]NHJ50074.1 hypothetical protein [Klebsiella quasipneumoniae subsp. similipneumoniae]NHJ64862.1 hypothetical protein [Klebsiella quasipneumoniae subsp. similipneumoniae]NHJ73354.1 hypothetical protein [Klebsiella quasipneumoniae subsp. similipneumoniae]NHJ80040.1 hypothetical protein [Klebsiella quasipneumoniae subsp. similipneumoniae]
MDELADAVKKTLIQRINTPLFGFVVLSWLGFNWDRLLIVFMGSGDIQDRIAKVKSEPYILLCSVVAPVFFGFIVAVAFPYANLAVSYCQRWAQGISDRNDIKRAKSESEAQEVIAEYKAKADSALAYQTSLFAKRNAEEELEVTRVTHNIESIKESYEEIEVQLNDVSSKLEGAREKLNEIENEINSKTDSLNTLVNELGPYEQIKNKIEEDRNRLMSIMGTIDSSVSSIFKETSKFGYRVNTDDEYTPDYDPTKVTKVTDEEARSAFRVISHAARVIDEFMQGTGYRIKEPRG